ncbi:MAG: prepilin-type N-terminal cleavage/methylation domain-containing protein [Candidatus Omnitrophica bacterium]|nr:prepilin-type N-terminal cleavage/methylation domain-containing protein [Candidatus Omnitrophota bacterium]
MIKPRGFTLIELVLVILLISVLIGLSTPQFKNTYEGLELDNSSRDLAQIMNFAREMAVVNRENYRIFIDPGERVYWLERYDASNEPAGYKRFAGRFGKAFRISGRLSVLSSGNEAVFYPDGHSDELRVVLASKAGEKRSVTAKPGGEIVISEQGIE